MSDPSSTYSPTINVESLNETVNSSSEDTARPPSTPPTPDGTHASSQVPDSATASGPDLLRDVDPMIVEALRGKDRIYVLRLGETMESLASQPGQRLELTPNTSYQRLLIHRCSAHYKVSVMTDSLSKAISVQWTIESRIPALRISEIVPPEISLKPARPILKEGVSSGRKPPQTSSRGGKPEAAGASSKKYMTIEEREAAYNEARSRIFKDLEGEDIANDDDAHSTSTYFTAKTSASNTTGVVDKKRMTIDEREAAYNEARSRIFMDFGEKEKVKDKASGSNTNGGSSTGGAGRPPRVPRNSRAPSPPSLHHLASYGPNVTPLSLSDSAQQSAPTVPALDPNQKLWFDQLLDEELDQLLDNQIDQFLDDQSPQDTRFELPPSLGVRPPTREHPTVPSSSDPVNASEQALEDIWRPLAAILSNKSAYKALLDLKDDKARAVLDILLKALDNPSIPIKLAHAALYAMMRLCTASGAYPQCLALQEIRYEAKPVASGAFGDIWKGHHRNHPVCLKVARVYQGSDVEHLIKIYMREAIMWSHLNHPNLLPFYGIYQVDERLGCVCLVSPWMQNGNINEYLKAHTEAPRLPLVHDILAGLKHLHKQSVVHGDLKGANILISNAGSACLADFGLSSIVDPEILRWTSLKTMTRVGGTVRWQAPELMDDLEDDPRPTLPSDVYSVASVMYEVFTDQLPFYEVKSDMTVMSRVMKGNRPTKPSADKALELSAEIWKVMERCWSTAPDQRPSVGQVAEKLASISPTELTTRRIEAQKLRTKEDVAMDALSPLSFRAAMRGQDTIFSTTEIDFLQEYARRLPQPTLYPDVPVLRFGDHDVNITNTPTMQVAAESGLTARIASEVAVHTDDPGAHNWNRAFSTNLHWTQPLAPQVTAPHYPPPVSSSPYIPPSTLGINAALPIAYRTQPALPQILPPPHFMIHPLLNAENPSFRTVFDLSVLEYSPLKHDFQQSFAYLTTEDLFTPFTAPSITYAQIICDLIPQWPVHIGSNQNLRSTPYQYVPLPPPLLVEDILRVIYGHLRMSITQTDWAQLSRPEQTEVTKAFTSRCRASAEDRGGGVRRIDYSKGKVWFKGLIQADNPFTFKLLLG